MPMPITVYLSHAVLEYGMRIVGQVDPQLVDLLNEANDLIRRHSGNQRQPTYHFDVYNHRIRWPWQKISFKNHHVQLVCGIYEDNPGEYRVVNAKDVRSYLLGFINSYYHVSPLNPLVKGIICHVERNR